MRPQISVVVLVMIVLAGGGLVNRASAQGCCKAGLCRIPTLPSASRSQPQAYTSNSDSVWSRIVPSASTPGRDRSLSLSIAPPPVPEDAQPQITAQSSDVGSPQAAVAGRTQFVISNPIDSETTVEYLLDGKTYALEPGMSLTISTERPYKIEFQRGETEETASYRVSRGTYEFSRSERGWELYRLASSR